MKGIIVLRSFVRLMLILIFLFLLGIMYVRVILFGMMLFLRNFFLSEMVKVFLFWRKCEVVMRGCVLMLGRK